MHFAKIFLILVFSSTDRGAQSYLPLRPAFGLFNVEDLVKFSDLVCAHREIVPQVKNAIL